MIATEGSHCGDFDIVKVVVFALACLTLRTENIDRLEAK